MPGPADHDTIAINPRLKVLHRMVTDGSCKFLSFDIFDTILWRRVPRPTDVFALVGAKLRREGRCPDWVTEAAFREMRIAAERKARTRRGSLGEEVSLFDIWEAMPLETFSASIEELVDAEMAMERAFTVIDHDMADVIRLAQKHDVPVVLVSDTYFTEDQLAHLLDRPELGSLSDVRVFRSHQHGRGKGNGLWPIVLKALGCGPE